MMNHSNLYFMKLFIQSGNVRDYLRTNPNKVFLEYKNKPNAFKCFCFESEICGRF